LGLHVFISFASPMQLSPPWAGVGLSQDLVRCWVPQPQETLHLLYDVKVPQPPSTMRAKIKLDQNAAQDLRKRFNFKETVC